MDTQKKMKFFEKLYLSISDFRFYPYVLKTEKLSDSYKYFIKLILLLSLIVAIYTSNFLFEIIDTIATRFDEDDPYKKQIVETSIGEIEIELPKEYSEEEIKLFVNEYKSENKYLFKIISFTIMYIIIFLAFLIMKIFIVSVAALFTAIVCVFFKMKTNTENYYKLAIYSLTLSFIVETLSILLVGGVKDYTVVSELLLAIVYIFYAVRAIRFDAFLIIVKNEKKKIKKDVVSNEKEKMDTKDEKSDNEEK